MQPKQPNTYRAVCVQGVRRAYGGGLVCTQLKISNALLTNNSNSRLQEFSQVLTHKSFFIQKHR